MTRSFLLICLLSLIGLQLSSCSSARYAKFLDESEAQLRYLAHTDGLSPEEKFHGLGEVLSKVADQALDMRSPRKTARFIETFVRRNESNINTLFTETSSWYKGLGPGKKLKFTGICLTKPYARRLIMQVPKVKKRVQKQSRRIELFLKISRFFRLG